MANDELPVTGAIISWARNRAGMSIEEARHTFAKIEEWEAGESAPTYPQLEKLADTFKLPIAAFFFPEPPRLPPIQESFRTLPDTEFDQIPRSVRLLLQTAKAHQLNLAELTQGRNPAGRIITHDLQFADNVTPEEMAASVRQYLGVSLATQFEWNDPDTALKGWRSALQAAGVFVFKEAFRAENYCGFSLYDEVFPVIYINNSVTKTRQCFTLFHELAHLVFETSGIDVVDERYIDELGERQRRIEVLCNRFAAHFLVPGNAFLAEMRGLPHTEASAERLATRFNVSREVIFRMFLDRGWVTQDAYQAASARWAAQRREGGTGGNYYNTKIIYLGREYLALAFTQYHQNRITETQLADYLDVKPKHVGTLEEYFLTGGQ
jgi:Zn-dependent peptidase ImmA (M78 family)